MTGRSDYILVVGGSDDRQLSHVMNALTRRDAPVVFIDHARPDLDVSLSFAPDGSVALHVDGRVLTAPTLLWTRTKLNPVLGAWNAETVPLYAQRSEWSGFIHWLDALYRDRSLVPLSRVAVAESKLVQFEAAANAGFALPETHVGVGKANAQRACRPDAKVILKPLVTPGLPGLDGGIDSYKRIIAMDVDQALVESASPEEFAAAPCLFQERICSGFEYRIIAFRERVFSYRIKQAVAGRVRPDERLLYGDDNGKRIYGAQYEYVETPPRLEAAARRFLEALGLQYGALDVIIEDDGRMVFLECNCEGQWGAAVGYNFDELCDHFASVLLQAFERRRDEPASHGQGSDRLARPEAPTGVVRAFPIEA